MKKLFSLLMTLVMMASLVACGGNSEEQPSQSGNDSGSTSQEELQAPELSGTMKVVATGDMYGPLFDKFTEETGVEVEVLHPHIEIGESSPLRSYEFFKQYLSEHPKPGFTGLFVVSMFPAREVIRAANECGLEIPRDFSLISLGRAGHKAGEDITRINTRRDLVVSYAVRLVKDYFEHKENTPMFHIVPTEIHQGNTVRNIGFPQ